MNKAILIIEDDADIRQALVLRLKSHGYTTHTAADAITGHALALRIRPALILLDLGLPGGDGIALLKKFGAFAATSAIPVIVLTGRDPQTHEEAARRLGAVAFFQKPPDVERLIAVIDQHVSSRQEDAPARATQRKILIIEDDADTRMGLVVRLRKAGYQTAIAGDAGTALTAVQRESPDLILLDLGLPAGDGFVVLERLKKTDRLESIPVIVLSARDPEANRSRALQAGAHAYFHKPADMKALLETIERELGR
jgi:DNA-binding response OmpR family regulator